MQKQLSKEERRHLVRRAVKMRETWQFGFLELFYTIYTMALASYLVTCITLSGYSLTVAGLAVSINTAGKFVSTLVWSTLSDHISSRKNVLGCVLLCNAAVQVFLCWFFVTTYNVAALIVAVVIFAMVRGTMPLIQSAESESFPVEMRGTGPGVATSISMVGRLLGPILAGAIVGSFGAPYVFLLTGAALVVSGSIAFTLPKTGGKKYGDRYIEAEMRPRGQEKVGAERVW